MAGLKSAGVAGEVLIIDSSTDRSPEIAEQHGARVLRVPKRGLGRAYIDAIPHIRGDYVIMGDCDLTYDFRELKPFIEKLDEGYDFVMGSRFRGRIEEGAMPPLHRYFGTPITTWILNIMYGTKYSDIHCGMRAMTKDALIRLNLESQSWEYASEMVLKAAKLKYRISEVPVFFYKDREGRLSHHKRAGWFSPWQAGWINLRAMFLYAPEFFLTKPGWLMFVTGFLLTLALSWGPIVVHGIQFQLHSMLLGLTAATLGYSAIQLGWLSNAVHNFEPEKTAALRKKFSYNRGVGGGILMGCAGLALNAILVAQWFQNGMRLESLFYPGVLGLLLIILGFQTFTFTLLFQTLSGKQKDRA